MRCSGFYTAFDAVAPAHAAGVVIRLTRILRAPALQPGFIVAVQNRRICSRRGRPQSFVEDIPKRRFGLGRSKTGQRHVRLVVNAGFPDSDELEPLVRHVQHQQGKVFSAAKYSPSPPWVDRNSTGNAQ